MIYVIHNILHIKFAYNHSNYELKSYLKLNHNSERSNVGQLYTTKNPRSVTIKDLVRFFGDHLRDTPSVKF